MVFVKPTQFTWIIVPIIQKIAFIVSLTSMLCFGLFFMDGILNIPCLPQVDRGNPYFKVFNLIPEWLTLGERVYDKILFNSILV